MVAYVFMTLLVHRIQVGTSQLVLVRIVIQLPGQSSHRQLGPLCNVILALRSTPQAEGGTKTEDICMMEPSLDDLTFYRSEELFYNLYQPSEKPTQFGTEFLNWKLFGCCLFSGRTCKTLKTLTGPTLGVPVSMIFTKKNSQHF